MVRIINGEIVQDDDPRLQKHNRQHASPQQRPVLAQQQQQFTAMSGRPAAVQQRPAAGFDWNAPPLRLLPNTQGPGGLPDVEIFAFPVPAVGLIAVAAAGIFFGWRGLLAGAIFGYLYLTYGPGAAGAGPAAAAAAGSSSSGFMGQQGAAGGAHGMFGGGDAGMQMGPAAGPGSRHGGPQQKPGSSSFPGKGHKLGSS